MMLSICLLGAVVAPEGESREGALFHAPVRLKAAEQFVKVDYPGYASPCFADVTGDGLGDLLVGQFDGGKIKVYENLGDGEFGAGKWLRAEGQIAEVPGVW